MSSTGDRSVHFNEEEPAEEGLLNQERRDTQHVLRRRRQDTFLISSLLF